MLGPMKTVAAIFALVAAIACCFVTLDCSPTRRASVPSAEVAPAAPAPEPLTTASSWQFSDNKNELTGEDEMTAVTGVGEVNLVVRRRGKKIDCYMTTNTFLETVENMDDRLSVVKYKFDDGPIVGQSWIISSNNTGLFVPGSVMPFVRKLRAAKRFVIEYQPAHTIPQTISFDVSGFPADFK